mgnify:CR=1 FL=1
MVFFFLLMNNNKLFFSLRSKMKDCHIGFAALMLAVSMFSTPVVLAQESSESDAEVMARRYSEACDSLLNNYYMRGFAHHHLRSSGSFSVEEFDALPDSVIEGRLRALRTVIPMTMNSEVRAHIRLYLRIMSRRLDLTLMQKEKYFPLFQEALDCYGVPDEVKYLTIVESALNPEATSRVGAAGLWQFMYNTGRVYDLEVNSVMDERRDPVKASYAAAHYLSDLHRIFDDWTLAIAAYNCGPGNVNKAIARSGGRRDFWEIYYNLPRETRGYIPSLIAVVYVMHYYDLHGLRPLNLEVPMRTDTVMVEKDVLMCYVAEATHVEQEALHSLNPQYRVDYIPASAAKRSLCLPTTAVASFIKMQDSIYAWSADSLQRRPMKVEPRGKGGSHASSGGYYTVRKGDTLSSIARKHGISVATLKKRNGLKSDNIRVGQKLKI